jgi:hypothetical protein
MSKDSDEFMKAVDEATKDFRLEGDAAPFLRTLWRNLIKSDLIDPETGHWTEKARTEN